MPLEASPLPPVTADQETASDGYAGRFAGEIGRWFLQEQEEAVLHGVGSCSTVVDVGGGHLQVAPALVRGGKKVTVTGSGPAARTQIAKLPETTITFLESPLLNLPVADRSFDCAVCLRLLAHCDPWTELIRELCRVSAKRVIVDYPTWQSCNLLTPWLFNAKKGVEKNTRPYILFWHKQIALAFAAQGFSLVEKKNQFFFPMAVHRAGKCVGVSTAGEGVASVLGLTALLGSPTVATFERRER